VIGIAGQMQNGKDVIADYLAKELDWTRSAFAYSVKRIFGETFNVSPEFIERWKVIPEPPPGFNKTVRQGLQFIGDGFRTIQSNIWIDLAFREKDKPVVLSDCRYINELARVKEEGGYVVLVWRPGYLNDDPNGSEAQIRPLVNWFADAGYEGAVSEWFEQAKTNNPPTPVGADFVDFFIINDGTLSDLYRKLDKFVLPNITKDQ